MTQSEQRKKRLTLAILTARRSRLIRQSLPLVDTLALVFTDSTPAGMPLDAITTATPMDTIKTRLGLSETLSEIHAGPLFGSFAGAGWEWINLAFLLGGLWLLKVRVIQWQIPAGMLGDGGEFKIEILAREESGNQTATESCFELE